MYEVVEISSIDRKSINESQIIALDMSASSFYIDNYNRSPNYQKVFKMSEEKLARLNQELSRRTKGSKRWEKIRCKIAKLSLKISNKRKDFADKQATFLVKNYKAIVVEDLYKKWSVLV